VLNSVRGCLSASEAEGIRQVCRFSASAQISEGISGIARNPLAVAATVLLLVLIIGGVLFPAIWSRKEERRTAALAVLDRLLPWRR
jgi:hypothetical protein